MSGDIFDHQKFGAVGGRPVLLAALGNWWVEGRNAANHPTMQGQPLTAKDSANHPTVHRTASHSKESCKPSYSAQDSLSQQRILQTILQCTGQPLTTKNSANHPTMQGQPLTTKNSANHPTMHRTASHSKEFCKPSYNAQDSLSQQRTLQTILQCTGQPLTTKNSANHPTVHRTASHNKELSGPKHQQCQGRETLGSISNHKVTLSFEVNIMMYSPNSGRFYQPHSWRISGNIRINYF